MHSLQLQLRVWIIGSAAVFYRIFCLGYFLVFTVSVWPKHRAVRLTRLCIRHGKSISVPNETIITAPQLEMVSNIKQKKLNYWSSRLLLKCILHCSCLMNVYYRHTFNEYFNQNVKESRFYLQNKKEYTILAVFQLLCLQKEFTVHLDGSLDLTAFPSKMKQSPGSAR